MFVAKNWGKANFNDKEPWRKSLKSKIWKFDVLPSSTFVTLFVQE